MPYKKRAWTEEERIAILRQPKPEIGPKDWMYLVLLVAIVVTSLSPQLFS